MNRCARADRGPCEGRPTWRVETRAPDGTLIETVGPVCFLHGLQEQAMAEGTPRYRELVKA